MHKSYYIWEAERQFSNTMFYKQPSSDSIQEYQRQLNRTLKELPIHRQEQIFKDPPQDKALYIFCPKYSSQATRDVLFSQT